MLELIVVIVILGILALLAIPTFQAVITRAEDSNTQATLASLTREASALAAFRGETTFTVADFEDAVADLPAAAVGVQAQGTQGWTLDSDVEGFSADSSTVHVALGGSPVGSVAALALSSSTGNCAMVTSAGVGAGVQGWIVEGVGGGEDCSGEVALDGPPDESAPTPDPDPDPDPDPVFEAPAVPGSLGVVAGDGSVSLSWDAVSPTPEAPVDGYRVFIDGSTTPAYEGSTPAFTATGLANGTEFSFTVAAFGAGGQSAESSPATATPITAPATPTGLAVTSSWPNLAWDAVGSTAAAPVTGYRLYRNGVQVYQGPLLNRNQSGTPGVLYDFTVSAYGPGGESAQSSVVQGATYSAPAVTFVTATVINYTSGTVSWNDHNSAATALSHYTVRANGSPLAGCTGIAPTGGTMSCSFTGAPMGATITVLAQGPWQSSISSNTIRLGSTQAPTITSLGAGSSGQIIVNFTPPTSGGTQTSYLVQRRACPITCTGTYANVATPAGSATSVTISGMTPGTTYQFRMYAINATGEHVLSNLMSRVAP